MIVLGTNVLSELLRPVPAPEAWLSAQDGATIFFTAVGEAELLHGVADSWEMARLGIKDWM